jgi:anti-anti-sigma factor
MLKVHTRKLGTAAFLCLEGQIVVGETELLHTVVDSLCDTSAVILDLAQVKTVDAHGLGVLLELRSRLQEKGIRFELMNVSKPLHRVLEITRLNSVFQINSKLELFPPIPRAFGARVAA